jgi:hypothetical protein
VSSTTISYEDFDFTSPVGASGDTRTIVFACVMLVVNGIVRLWKKMPEGNDFHAEEAF